MTFKEILSADKYKWKWTTKHPFLNLAQYRYVYVLRQCQRHTNKMNPMYYIWRLVHKHQETKYITGIPVCVKIGPGLYLGHLGNVFVHPNAVIGSNVNIYQGVSIAHANRGKRKGCPTIGDRVWIGPNAVLSGNIHVGNNVLIAANAFVNFDVPDNSIVLGNPGQIIPSKDACADYLPEQLV